MGRDKSKLGMATPAAIVLFSVFLMAAIIALSMAIRMIETMKIQSLGVYSLEYINRAILHCIIYPQSSAEVMVSLSADEAIEFTEKGVSFTSKNKVEKSLLENLRLQSDQYKDVIRVSSRDLGNGVGISYKRIPPSGSGEWKTIHFTPIKISQGRFKIIFHSISFTDIRVIVIRL